MATVAVAVVVCGTIAGVALAKGAPDRWLSYVVSPDRIPDFFRLAGPDAV